MKRQLFALFIAFLIPFSESEGQILPFTHYTPDREINALPSAEVHEVFQDGLGYIWFSIYSSGLVRYNGVSMETFGQEDGLRDLTVWDLIEDPTGRLWVTSNAGLVVSEEPLSQYDAGKRVRFISASNNVDIIDHSVNHNRMTVDREGWLWVGTENIGIVRYRFNEKNILEADTISTDPSRTGNEISVRALTARKDGSVWAALLDGNLLRFKTGEEPKIFSASENEYTNALYESADGTLWGGDKDGRIWQLRENGDGTTVAFSEVNRMLSSNISDITADHAGRIWVSSEGSGLLVIDGESPADATLITRSNGLLSEVVFGVMEDREQNLWIAQSGGGSKLKYNYRAFTNVTSTSIAGEQPLLPSPSINTIQLTDNKIQNDPCSFWAGTSEGGVACINEQFESQFIQFEDGLAGNWVNGMAYDTYGRLWIGSTRGLNSLSFNKTPYLENLKSSTTLQVFGQEADLASYGTASILSIQKLGIPSGKDGNQKLESLWLPAYHRVYALLDNTFIMLDEEWGLPPTIYHTSAIDSLGYLWIGTRDRGIYRSRIPVSTETFTGETEIANRSDFFQLWWSVEDGAPTNQIDNLFWSNGYMWVGTTNGLIALDALTKEINHFISNADGLLANNITSLAKSPVTGKFWVGTNQGLAEIDPDSGKVVHTVTKAEGLVDNEV
ncbi:MAG: two-component regulator propeller domain-containing protein, partial [Balneolaceae bacterium]|nr:two-component regulator propeller domain-containing protein [Balneolaceae bacterium]